MTHSRRGIFGLLVSAIAAAGFGAAALAAVPASTVDLGRAISFASIVAPDTMIYMTTNSIHGTVDLYITLHGDNYKIIAAVTVKADQYHNDHTMASGFLVGHAGDSFRWGAVFDAMDAHNERAKKIHDARHAAQGFVNAGRAGGAPVTGASVGTGALVGYPLPT